MKPNLMELQIDLGALDFIMAEVTKKFGGIIAFDGFDSVLRKQFPFEKTTPPRIFGSYSASCFFLIDVVVAIGHRCFMDSHARRPVAAATNLMLTSLTQFDELEGVCSPAA